MEPDSNRGNLGVEPVAYLMSRLPTNEYVEIRDERYYVAGTRIGLDVLIHDFRRGETPEAIFQASIPSAHLRRCTGPLPSFWSNLRLLIRISSSKKCLGKNSASSIRSRMI